MKKIWICACCLLAGVAAGWFSRGFSGKEEVLPQTSKRRAGAVSREIVTVRDKTAEHEVEALKKRVRELEGALAAAGRVAAEEVSAAVRSAEEKAEHRNPRRDFESRMEKMRKENPEQFAEMQKRHEQWRKERRQREQDRTEFLTSLDTSRMGADAKANHEQLLSQIEKVNLMMENFRNQRENGGREQTEEQRRAGGEAMREAMDTLRQLYDTERTYLLTSTAEAAGYTGDDAADFVETIQTIYNNTSAFGMRGGRGPGGPRP